METLLVKISPQERPPVSTPERVYRKDDNTPPSPTSIATDEHELPILKAYNPNSLNFRTHFSTNGTLIASRSKKTVTVP